MAGSAKTGTVRRQGLIEIVNETVQFTHLSAKEFLFQKPKNTSSVKNEYLINKTKTVTNTCSKWRFSRLKFQSR